MKDYRDIAREAMSDGEYLSHSGCHCPACDSEDIQGTGGNSTDCAYHTEHLRCDACGATWTEAYTLVGYTNLETKAVQP